MLAVSCSSLSGAAALQPRRAAAASTHRAVSTRSSAVNIVATAARDERARAADGDDASTSGGILSGEWAPTWSLGLGVTPARPMRSQQRRMTSTRSSATDTAFYLEQAATLAIAKEWDARSALASFDDVQAFYAARRK